MEEVSFLFSLKRSGGNSCLILQIYLGTLLEQGTYMYYDGYNDLPYKIYC